jgi:hypothetical protein
VDAALHDAAGRLRDEAHDRERGDGLARARLAHDAERLALVDVQIDAVDGAHDAVIGEEVRLQPADVQQPFGHGSSYQVFVSSVSASSARPMSSASMSL